MTMKKAGLILTFLVALLPAWGQSRNMELPFLPYRATNHIKTIQAYSINAQTGERKKSYTEHYDRRGYDADTNCRNVYDRQGRLTLQERYRWVSSTANPTPRRELSGRNSLVYAPDGTVEYYKSEIFGGHYAGLTEYQLYSSTVHPRFGLTELVYLCKYNNEWVDTVRLYREYDSVGNLVRELCDAEDGYERRLYYDASRRVVASRTYNYESWDTLDYNYDLQGKLVSQTGKLYDIDYEADITVSFRPDGTVSERREHWINTEDPSEFEDAFYRYDERGFLVYEKDAAGIKEFEVEYWE